MKFSADTIIILKNYATINPGVIFSPGSVLRTIHPQKTIIGTAQITEVFEKEAAIYDLPRFLATLSLFEDPEVEFGNGKFLITSGNTKVTYTYAAADMIVKAPIKTNLPPPDVSIKISWKELDSIIRASGIMKLPDIAFVAEEGTIKITVTDSRNSTADTYSAVVAEGLECKDFRMLVKVENLRLLPLDYEIGLSTAGFAKFTGANIDYLVVSEAAK